MFDRYKDRVPFYAVYILEAHPSDVWQMESNVRDHVIYASPRSEQERAGMAESCVRKLGIKFPALVDDYSNVVEHAYTGWPDRIYLIDSEGRVAYKSQAGPFGFHADQLRAALERIVH